MAAPHAKHVSDGPGNRVTRKRREESVRTASRSLRAPQNSCRYSTMWLVEMVACGLRAVLDEIDLMDTKGRQHRQEEHTEQRRQRKKSPNYHAVPYAHKRLADDIYPRAHETRPSKEKTP
ncbi:hypothetical protein EXIGLDRAFT_490521 [Exidia glandulosa HHB12029]|uniref:Uncharacterized protein n=1 Tax=Exidia glandulosa HHB12029 TaxID=1314781 RepID=A0A165JN51_EXIGL|nr:hypothetical protein EXIGLDRAFT_490521 [Exidia glandulosa HHB12029]